MDNDKTILEPFTNSDLEKLNELKASKAAINEKKIRHDWSQTNNCVFFTIYQKNVETNNFLYYIKSDYIFLIIKINETEIYPLEKFFFSKIIPSKTTITITPMKIELSLEKDIKELKWDQLEKKTNDVQEKDENVLNPFTGKSIQEWTKFAQSIGEDEDNQSIDHFFRKIYKDGDDDLKRAMIKSFVSTTVYISKVLIFIDAYILTIIPYWEVIIFLLVCCHKNINQPIGVSSLLSKPQTELSYQQIGKMYKIKIMKRKKITN